jgi:putative Holliday junction resolvase
MGRILAIDYGLKRTGLAVTDSLKMIAGPLDTVATSDLILYLQKYIATENVERIVVGEPKQMNSEYSQIEPHIRKFIQTFEQVCPDIPVVRFDERFTSKMAAGAMLTGGLKKMQRRDKATVDRVSAVILLQSYMDSHNFKFI